MKPILHQSALPSHYNNEARFYDVFNEKNSRSINQTIEKVLKKHKVKTVLDMTCGTGSQVFWLTKRGFHVVGSDINDNMLKVAKAKVKKACLDIKFVKADMRDARLGSFDAVLTIFNAVGHLTKADFARAMRNIYANLNDGGLYIFDIFNLDFLLNKDNITTLTIDWLKNVDGCRARVVQYSTIDDAGILASFTTEFEMQGPGSTKESKSAQTLQVYTAKQLKMLLEENGFRTLTQCAIDGSRFFKQRIDRIFTVAQKI